MKKTRILAICRFVLLVIVAVIIGVRVYTWNAESLAGNRMPMPFGYGMAVVLSGSMEPTMTKGDLIVVRETDTFAHDEVIVFQDGQSLVVHRIIDMHGDSVTTKGDANNTSDEPIDISNIKGKVIFKIPFIGNVINYIKTPIGTTIVIALAIFLLEFPRYLEKQKDAEEIEKIKEEIRKLKNENEH